MRGWEYCALTSDGTDWFVGEFRAEGATQRRVAADDRAPGPAVAGVIAELGRDGWELAGYHLQPHAHYLFKRPLPDR